MAKVIKIVGHTIYDNMYVKHMDFETNRLTTTLDPHDAKKFPSLLEAGEYWKTQSKTHPIRSHDGKPNRPLTAFTVTFENVEDD